MGAMLLLAGTYLAQVPMLKLVSIVFYIVLVSVPFLPDMSK